MLYTLNTLSSVTSKRCPSSRFAPGLGLGTYLFVKVPRPGDNDVTFPVFESSCHLLLSVLPLKGRGNPVKCLAQGYNKRPYRHISIL